MRGEDPPSSYFKYGRGGSPPHARGRRNQRYAQGQYRRITPACAGKTFPSSRPRPSARDHPRMRGEDPRVSGVARCLVGSPPHARGRRTRRRSLLRERGITPACAGKTSAMDRESMKVADHPRMRGEDLGVGDERDELAGSPPHARGRQLDSPGNPTKPTISLPVFLHSQPSPLKRFLLWVLGL